MNDSNTSSLISNDSNNVDWINWVFLSLCVFGFLTNSVSSIVFLHERRFKDIRYKYLSVKSISNLIYFILSILSVFFTFCSTCGPSKTYFGAIYSIYISFYYCQCLISLRLLTEIIIAFRTYSIMIKKDWLRKFSFRFIATLLFILVLLWYCYIPIGIEIIQISGTGNYRLSYNDFGRSQAFSILFILHAFLHMFLACFVLSIMNVINLIGYKRWNSNRRVAFAVNSQNALADADSNSKPIQIHILIFTCSVINIIFEISQLQSHSKIKF